MTVEARDGGDTTGEDTFYKSATANIIITIEVKQLIFLTKLVVMINLIITGEKPLQKINQLRNRVKNRKSKSFS